MPSSAESNVTAPLGSGYAMPLRRVQGDAQDVTVWKMYRGASRLRNCSDCPRWTTAGRPAAPRVVRSPWL